MIKVQNMTSNKGNTIANQFIIIDDENSTRLFQSYKSIIVLIDDKNSTTTLDSRYWDYSRTTGKYRNQFLGETKAETQAKIKSGEYLLADLN